MKRTTNNDTEVKETPTAAADLFCGLLGPVLVRRAGTVLDVGPPKRRGLLVRLLLEEGRVVSTDRLCEDLWPGRPLPRAVVSLQADISRLRTVLEPERPRHGKAGLLVRESNGYALRVPPEARDTVRFEREVARAGRLLAGGRAAEARREVEYALSLWRGTALQDVRDYLFAVRPATQLEEARVAAEELHISTLLQDGEVRQAVSAAEALTERHPLREVAWGLLLCALYFTGRHADALARFQELRTHLSEDLGLQPSPVVSELQEAILRHDLAFVTHTSRSLVAAGYEDALLSREPRVLETVRGSRDDARPQPRPGSAADGTAPRGLPDEDPAVLPAGGPGLRPAQLPPAAAFFTGRRAELDALHALVPKQAGKSAAPPVAVIGGVPGVGKTTVALHFAHQVSGSFPDGQLFADLRGFGPGGAAMEPEEVLQQFLISLGVPPAAVPARTTACTALLRTVLAERRVLLVLDNARDEDQVRPLLPGASGCMVVITSRNQLHGLVTTAGARTLTLDTPPVADVRDALARRLGAPRVQAEPEAAEEIIRLCARLPLAVALAAARATLHPEFPLGALADDMRAGEGTLDAFSSFDTAVDVRAVFSWSYGALTPPAARLFRLLALHPGPCFSAAAAASLAGLPPADTRRLLTELTRTRMVNERAPGRFGFHDLLHIYARELVGEHETETARTEALVRMYDHYLHTASLSGPSITLTPWSAVPPPVPGVTPERLGDEQQVMAWYATEQAVLRAVLRQAADTGFDRHATHLAWRIQDYLVTQGRLSEAAAVFFIALGAARRCGDQVEQARLHRALAGCLGKAGRHEEAMTHMSTAVALLEGCDEPAEQIHVQLALGAILHRAGDDEAALACALKGLDMARRCSDELLETVACKGTAWYLTVLGRHLEALPYCQQAIADFRRLGLPHWAAYVWNTLGHVHHHLGDHRQAIVCYRTALDLMERAGDRFTPVGTLVRLGDTHLSAGDLAAARQTWTLALELAEERPEVHPLPEIRQRLADTGEQHGD
ncbi:AfsR/SARP family transcriptional regulator [Streptomyces lomondensis]|uniref:SARP family transcriptional regulator n=1 Tax=Streptomyces lomondensis TaxID=68229 RepID=A0ABQ2XUB4_9ACTN|nr:BTAD domain-containing putative transcriptional regulator [Streptomyces lomondensis]MCF0082716.1 tetratricopeptide repeat protein [Streptomyces lomondensis]GGX32205.1 SARP family transcriptional regulator [Streptomyces lomondensis]